MSFLYWHVAGIYLHNELECGMNGVEGMERPACLVGYFFFSVFTDLFIMSRSPSVARAHECPFFDLNVLRMPMNVLRSTFGLHDVCISLISLISVFCEMSACGQESDDLIIHELAIH